MKEQKVKEVKLVEYKPATCLSSHNQHKYYWLAKKYILLVKLSFSIVSSVLVVQLYYIEVDRVEEWEIKKMLNKRKIRGVVKYLV